MKKIEIEIPEGKDAQWVNGVLTLVDEQDVTERIKTFGDACNALGDEHPFVKEYWGVVNINLDIAQDLIAYLKLRIITTALNEGWEPKFVEEEKRWYAQYDFITEEDYNNTTDEVRVPLRVGYSVRVAGGVRLAFKSKELAEYAAKQFIDIYADYCFKSK